MTKRKTPDIYFENHGTIAMIRPMTAAGREWCDDNIVAEDWQLMGEAIAAEPRMVPDIITGAMEFGLTVEVL